MIDFTDSNDHFYTTDVITLKEWRTEWKTCPIQRDHDVRAKEEKHQKKFRKRHPDHLQVNGVILSRDCIDESLQVLSIQKEPNSRLTDIPEIFVGQVVYVKMDNLLT